MAVELATGYISLVPSARGFGRAISREISGPLNTAGAEAGETTSRRFGNTFVAGVGTAATRGALALTAGFALAAGVGIKIAADFEQTTIAFEGILGSADEAKTVLGDLRDFAAKTPFEFTGLADSAKALLGVGFGAEEIIPTMQTLGDVAATLGVGEDGIKGVVRALGQIKGKGKVSAEELQQISEQIPGFSAIGAIAEGLGVTTEEAFDLMAKGAIPASEGIEAILTGMENFPGASGAMERQSKTLNGVISTFKDTLSTTAIDFITPYLPAISAGVSAFGGFIQNTAVPALDGFIHLITDTVVPGIEGLIDIFGEEGIRGVFEALGSAIETNAPIVGDKLLALGQTLIDWIAPRIPGLLGELANFAGAAITWFQETGAPMLVEGTGALVGALWQWINDPEDGAIVNLLEALPGFATALTDWLSDEMVPSAFEGGKEIGVAIVAGIFSAVGEELQLPPGASLDIPGIGKVDLPDWAVKERAKGGPVASNHMFLVGEEGPELFVPSRSGVILPNGASLPAAGAGTSPLVGMFAPTVVQMPGEDSVTTAMRELHRVQLLVPS